jgi:ATP-dependent DNA helicase PIF1
MTQEEALAILKTGGNVFLTGEPGSGKTYTINRYVAWLMEHGIEVAITAATGIAATHIGGMTIHSWSGIGIKRVLTAYDLDALSQNKRIVRNVRDTKVLVIDEVSMLSATTLDMVDAVCRELRGSVEPFGGLQVVFVGDFFQLPPIVSRDLSPDLSLYDGIDEAPRSEFAFDADAWRALTPIVCYLSEQHRQEDGAFLELLSAIRAQRFSEEHRALLVTRYAQRAEDVPQLYSHNADVDTINDRALAALPGPSHIFTMESDGPERLVETLKRGCLSPETLSLKIDAKVMFTKNDILRGAFANGTLGTVTGFNSGGMPIVTTRTGRSIAPEPMEWSIVDNGRIIAQITQVPLRLAWAMTVHKSQGMSLDAAHMDLSGAFEYGQGYVALSRVRTLAGLSLAGFNERALEIHPEIAARDMTFREASNAARGAFAVMPEVELTKMHTNFIRACGGSVATVPPASRISKRASPKLPTRQATKELLDRKLSLAAIAKERGLTQGTIIAHLEQLVGSGDINPTKDAAHILIEHEAAITAVHQMLDKHGHQSSTELFKHLKGKVSYDLIRLARVFYLEE